MIRRFLNGETRLRRLKVDVSEITPDTDILDDLGADSLDVVEILMSIEDTYGITIPDDEVQNLRTINLLTNYIEAKQ